MMRRALVGGGGVLLLRFAGLLLLPFALADELMDFKIIDLVLACSKAEMTAKK